MTDRERAHAKRAREKQRESERVAVGVLAGALALLESVGSIPVAVEQATADVVTAAVGLIRERPNYIYIYI